MKVWHIDASGRDEKSHSRRITKQFVDRLSAKKTIESNMLDVGAGLPFLTNEMIESYFTSSDKRTDEQKHAIAASNEIVRCARECDVWVMGIPIYNFSMPATFKAFIDLLIRLRETFDYGENGPVGLLKNKHVFVVVTSGGTEIGSDVDFLTPWLKHCLSFIGIENINFINADKYNVKKDEEIKQQIELMTTSITCT